jgi:hypothetical protein
MKPTSIFALTLLAALPALALNDASWVSRTGLDTNACTSTAPCKTFQHAHDVTSAGGIVKALDAADYGPVNVSKAITIDGNGVGAEIELLVSQNGINVSAGPVTVRDLTIHGPGNAAIFVASADVYVENVTITGGPSYGVVANGASGAVHMTAKNLTVTGAGSYGISIYGASASIRDSVLRATVAGPGISVASTSGVPAAVALIERTDLSFNTTGLVSDNQNTGGGATVRISDSVITGNGTGISAVNGGQIITFRTNMLAGNTTDGSTPFSISLK